MTASLAGLTDRSGGWGALLRALLDEAKGDRYQPGRSPLPGKRSNLQLCSCNCLSEARLHCRNTN